MRGLIIQMLAQAKRHFNSKLTELLGSIHSLKSQDKLTPKESILASLTKLTKLRLHALLCTQHDQYLRRLKLHQYTYNNRPGNFLAHKLKTRSAKVRIHFIIHPFTKKKLTNPQAIAKAFSDYYNVLYNLKEDMSTPQSTPDLINDFRCNLM